MIIVLLWSTCEDVLIFLLFLCSFFICVFHFMFLICVFMIVILLFYLTYFKKNSNIFSIWLTILFDYSSYPSLTSHWGLTCMWFQHSLWSRRPLNEDSMRWLEKSLMRHYFLPIYIYPFIISFQATSFAKYFYISSYWLKPLPFFTSKYFRLLCLHTFL